MLLGIAIEMVGINMASEINLAVAIHASNDTI